MRCAGSCLKIKEDGKICDMKASIFVLHIILSIDTANNQKAQKQLYKTFQKNARMAMPKSIQTRCGWHYARIQMNSKVNILHDSRASISVLSYVIIGTATYKVMGLY